MKAQAHAMSRIRIHIFIFRDGFYSIFFFRFLSFVCKYVNKIGISIARMQLTVEYIDY